jgi:hypothetical protein
MVEFHELVLAGLGTKTEDLESARISSRLKK